MASNGEGPAVRLTHRYTHAVDRARVVHAGDVRKGTNVPYLSHLLEVSGIVLEYGGSEDEAIAALLHAAADEGGGEAQLAAIRLDFGDEVADIVRDLSESLLPGTTEMAPWLERKQAYLHHLNTVTKTSMFVCAADKLANVMSLRADYRNYGPDLWARFNAPRAAELWYYGHASRFVSMKLTKGRRADLAEELAFQTASFRAQVCKREDLTDPELEAELSAFFTVNTAKVEKERSRAAELERGRSGRRARKQERKDEKRASKGRRD